MSYDIRFGVKVEGMDGYIAVIGEPEYSSPTYNLRDMFVACMDWDYMQGEWYKCQEVLPKIEQGLHKLKFNGGAYKKYNPKNGWGSVESAIEALESVLDEIEHLTSGNWTWNKIPLQHLWMCW